MNYSPSFCKGAIEGIDFLLYNYQDILNENTFSRQSLENAKEIFVEQLKNVQHKTEIDKTSYKEKLKAKKNIIQRYGRTFISSEIEKDQKYLECLNEIEHSLNTFIINYEKPEDLQYDLGYYQILHSIIKKLKIKYRCSEIKLEKQNDSISELILIYKEYGMKILTAEASTTFITEAKKSYHYLLGLKDAMTFCNDKYGDLMNENYDEQIEIINNKLENKKRVI